MITVNIIAAACAAVALLAFAIASHRREIGGRIAPLIMGSALCSTSVLFSSVAALIAPKNERLMIATTAYSFICAGLLFVGLWRFYRERRRAGAE